MNNPNTIKTTLRAPRLFWRKIRCIARERNVSANELVLNTLKQEFNFVEVKV
jgi:predicted DNA-binding ribbon-helix-helix protein